MENISFGYYFVNKTWKEHMYNINLFGYFISITLKIVILKTWLI